MIALDTPSIQAAIKAAALKIQDDFAAARDRVPDFDDIDDFPEHARPVYLSAADFRDGYWSAIPGDTQDVMAAVVDQANAEGWYPAGFFENGRDSELIALAEEIQAGRAKTDFPLVLRPGADDFELTILRNGAGEWRAELIHPSYGRCDPEGFQVGTGLGNFSADELAAMNAGIDGLDLDGLDDDEAVHAIFNELIENHLMVPAEEDLDDYHADTLTDPARHLREVYAAERERSFDPFAGYQSWSSWDELSKRKSAPAVQTAALPGLENIDKPAPSSGPSFAP